MRLLGLLLSGALICIRAQPGDLKLPTLGLAYDPEEKTIRPIRGIPGAAWLAQGLETAIPLTAATISPSQDFGFGAAIGNPQMRLIKFSAEGIVATLPIAGVAAEVSKVVFSPLGASALLAGNGLQVLSGLPDSPFLRDIGPPDGGPWAAMAVSDDGKSVLLASGQGVTDPVWLVAGGGARQVPLPGAVAAIAFRAQSNDAVAVTRSGDVYVIRDAGRSTEVRQVYSGDERTADPAATYFAGDGSHAYTASRSGVLAIVDLATASASAISCQCVPSSLAPLRSSRLFRITDPSTGPVMLLDGRGATPRLWFVPSGRER